MITIEKGDAVQGSTCPFCSQGNLAMREYIQNGSSEVYVNAMAVLCLSCGAQGPTSNTWAGMKEKALAAWEKRP